MRLRDVADPTNLQVVVLGREVSEDLPSPVRRDVVEGMDSVAEPRRVPDRPFDEEVVVANQDDSDDASAHPARPADASPLPASRLR